MLLPSTHAAALLLLLLSVVGLGSWAATLRAAGVDWRFELYALDFAAGATLLSVLAAWTLGVFGSDLSFIDRTAVAGLRSQALAFSGGFVFGIGNLLFLATLSLLGIAAGFALVFALLLPVWSLLNYAAGNSSSLALLLGGVVFSALALALSIFSQHRPALAKRGARRGAPPAMTRSSKGAISGICAGLFTGSSFPLLERALWGDLGLGAYAGFLMFCLGLIASTGVFSFFFWNIAIEGGRLSWISYWRAPRFQHLWGFGGGLIWGTGLLAWLLAQSAPPVENPQRFIVFSAMAASALLAVAWGLAKYKEFRSASERSKVLFGAALAAFICGVLLLTWGQSTPQIPAALR